MHPWCGSARGADPGPAASTGRKRPVLQEAEKDEEAHKLLTEAQRRPLALLSAFPAAPELPTVVGRLRGSMGPMRERAFGPPRLAGRGRSPGLSRQDGSEGLRFEFAPLPVTLRPDAARTGESEMSDPLDPSSMAAATSDDAAALPDDLPKLVALVRRMDHAQDAQLEATSCLRDEVATLRGLLARLIQILTPDQPDEEGPTLRDLIERVIRQQSEIALLLKETLGATTRVETRLVGVAPPRS